MIDMKKEKWKEIIEQLENGEISEESAHEEIMRNYGIPDQERIRQCN
ncbi:MAG: hypothetical protein ACXQS3_04365 [Candidatus Methanofastidiosia archaeon]